MKNLLLLFALFAGMHPFAQDTAKTNLKSKTLQTVVVAALKKPIEVYPDRTILNIDARPSAIGENTLELLRRSPGVSVDGNENLQMSGKSGVAVYIDGKNTQLSGQDLAQLLKSIEASNIRQIELISNPPAKYDAAGNAGIINIRLKKSLTDGFNGNLTGSFVQSNHARQTAATNLNWRKKKTVLFFNGGLNQGLQHVTANNDRTAGSRTFTQRSLEKDYFNGYSVRAGADYLLNPKTTFGILWMSNNRFTRMNNISTTRLQLPGGDDTLISTHSVAPFPSGRHSLNLNYAYTGSSSELLLDADYTLFGSSVGNQLSNRFTSGGRPLGATETNNDQRVRIRLASVKGDWTKNLQQAGKLETGFKFTDTRTENNLTVQNRAGTSWLSDTGKTNFFRFNETIAALYASLKGGGKKFSWQAGLRGEYSRVKGTSVDLKALRQERPDTGYLNLFPTVFLQYRLSEKHSLGLTANRRIDRPAYQDQNPFIYALDALNSEGGNASLLPQFSNSVELAYTYRYATSLKVSYAKTAGYIEQLTYQDGKNTIMIPQNAGTREMWTFSFSTPLQPVRRWSVYLSLAPYYHFYKTLLSGWGLQETRRAGSWGFNGYMNNNITLGKSWTATVSGWYDFQNRKTIYVAKPLGSLDFGLQKGVAKEKITLKLSIADLLNTQRWQQTASNSTLHLTTYRKWESRNLTAGLSWRFGNSKIKPARNREGLNEEARRIREQGN